jgi:hypothetical protein
LKSLSDVLIETLDPVLTGDKWFNGFIKRHDELSYKRSEYLSRSRAAVTEERIRDWFAETEKWLEDDLLALKDPTTNPNRIWNMDESSFFVNPSGILVVGETGNESTVP